MMLSVIQTSLNREGGCRILALGADTRPRIAWTDGKFLSTLTPRRPPRDLEDFLRRGVKRIRTKFHFQPDIIAFDPHPLFVSCQQAPVLRKDFFPKARLATVYHHWAHAANLVVDTGRTTPFIGVAFDGTGFGVDGRIWGGEFFFCARRGFERLAHLKYQPLPGNEAAIKEPWRAAYGILKTAACNRRPADGFLKKIPKDKVRIVDRMIEQGFQTPMTSSAGRLFDAAAAFLGLTFAVDQPAAAARSVEQAAFSCRRDVGGYEISLTKDVSGCLILDTGELFLRMRRDASRGMAKSVMARKFHHAVAGGIFEVCRRLAKRCGVSDIYVSGGVFMNRILTEKMKELFAGSRLRLIIPAPEHMTDDAIARGQIGYCLYVREPRQ
jgi:hydrogenase maturation protein HypF